MDVNALGIIADARVAHLHHLVKPQRAIASCTRMVAQWAETVEKMFSEILARPLPRQGQTNIIMNHCGSTKT